MKFLFLFHYPGYMRYFDATVRLLAERGHHVAISFDSPHKQPEGAEALVGATGTIERLDRAPPRGDAWAPIARAVRGTIDYARYLHPRFADSPYLRDRMRKVLPPVLRFLGRRDTTFAWVASALVRWFTAIEQAVPSSPRIDAFLHSINPDALVISPLVMHGGPQADYVKSARALGIRSALCVASWDHLTTKGLMRVQPDLVAVWNEEQRREAVDMHGTAPERVVVTGAQPFDRWFDRTPSADRESFCRKIGLRPDRPFILFVGSTASISAPEAEVTFVRDWARTVRDGLRETVGEVGVLVRPHPYNSAHWADADLSDLANVAVYPRHGANPVNERDRADYFDSLFHSVAVVGVNTSAMIEAAIVGRPVHSILAPQFSDTQHGTLHFRYLLPENGGFVQTATSLAEHVGQLAETLQTPDRQHGAHQRFVGAFVRPRGLDRPCTPVLADTLEGLAALGPLPRQRASIGFPVFRAQLWAFRGLIGAHEQFVVYLERTDRRVRNVRKRLKIRRKKWIHYRRQRVAALRRVASAQRKALRRLLVER